MNVYFPNRLDGSIDNTYTGTLPAGWDVDIQKIQIYAGNYSDRSIAINNLSITSEIAKRHNVTFTYEDTDGNSLSALKANSTVQAVAGTSIESLITSTLNSSFYNGDASIRYDYSTFAADGSATEVPEDDISVKLKFVANARFTRSVQAVEKDNTSNVLKADLASGYAYAGEDLKLHWSKYIYASSKWYETTTVTGTYSTSGTSDIEFSSSDINYFFEFENLTKSGSFAATSSGDDLSNNNSARLGKSSRVWTTALAAGTYTLNTYCYGENAKSSSLSMYYCDTDGSNLVYIGETTATTASFWRLKETTGIVIPEGKALCLYNNDASNNSNYLTDYITLTRTGAAEKSVTVSSAGFATYVNSDYDLDFSETDIKAYKVKVSEKGVATLTKVDNVPAGTPVLLSKAGGATEAIPVMTGAAAVSDNDLVAGTGAAVATSDGDYTNMILNNVDSKIGFYFANGQTVAANRAYLHIATSLAPTAASRMVMVFDDNQTTGIVSAMKQPNTGQVYDLQGRRVAQPTKGLYIINGKKIIVK